MKQKKRNAVVSESELAIEPRSSADIPVSEGFRRHLSAHQRRHDQHRHLFQRNFPEAGSEK